MVGPLLSSKYRVPSRRPGAIPRRRLADRLEAACRSALVIVSAPAGFGKTTLLTEWLAAGGAGDAAVAWVSLDRRDNDAVTFWTYVVTAIQTATSGFGIGALEVLASSAASTDAALAALLNDLDGRSTDLVLVLDDYHLVETPEVHAGMVFLLEHLPPRVHIVLATRTDPRLPLAQLRARDQLVEVRATDLRFTPEETAASAPASSPASTRCSSAT